VVGVFLRGEDNPFPVGNERNGKNSLFWTDKEIAMFYERNIAIIHAHANGQWLAIRESMWHNVHVHKQTNSRTITG